jgi:hypothetical protein
MNSGLNVRQSIILVVMGLYLAAADSGIVPPALNAQGYYDTMWGYLMTSLHVRHLSWLLPLPSWTRDMHCNVVDCVSTS